MARRRLAGSAQPRRYRRTPGAAACAVRRTRDRLCGSGPAGSHPGKVPHGLDLARGRRRDSRAHLERPRRSTACVSAIVRNRGCGSLGRAALAQRIAVAPGLVEFVLGGVRRARSAGEEVADPYHLPRTGNLAHPLTARMLRAITWPMLSDKYIVGVRSETESRAEPCKPAAALASYLPFSSPGCVHARPGGCSTGS